MASILFLTIAVTSLTATLAAPHDHDKSPELPAPHSPGESELVGAPSQPQKRTAWEVFNVTDPGPAFWKELRARSKNASFGSYLHNDIEIPEDFERQGYIKTGWRWPNGMIPVYIDPVWNATERKLITKGMDILMSLTCIRFEDYNASNPKHFRFVKVEKAEPDFGCRALIGRHNMPKGQWVKLEQNDYCLTPATIAHEFIHTIGFWHEQQRPDRDEYVTIQFENIPESRYDDFKIWDGLKTFGTPYDYNSIMHYPAYLNWAINPDLPAITSKTGTPIEPSEDALTKLDVQKIQNMYKGICK